MPRHSVYVLSAAGLVVFTAVLTHLASERRAAEQEQLAMLWVLNLSDGRNSLLDIAERSDLPLSVIHDVALALRRADLLAEHDEGLP